MTTQQTTTPTASVRFEREYEASIEDLWYLWTTKQGFEAWWGPEGFRVEVRALELREGGALDYDMIADGPEQIAHMQREGMPLSHATHGTFVEVVPLRRLKIRHVIDFLPDQPPYENHMTLELFAEGTRVRMVVTVDRHTTEEWTARASEGMASQLTKVPAALARLAAARE